MHNEINISANCKIVSNIGETDIDIKNSKVLYKEKFLY